MQTLYLNGNHLASIADHAFRGLPSLRNLYLERNLIADLSQQVEHRNVKH